jgi:FkbM family methyltransferase
VKLNRWSAVFEPRPGTTDAEVIGEVWTRNDYRVRPEGFSGTVCLDVGANCGAFSVLAAKAGARVIAVEPEPQNRARLLHHLALNRVVDRVEVLTEAITDRTGDRLRIADTGGGAHLDVDGVEVYSLSFADLIAKYAPVHLVKFDAEMAEWLAFESVTAEYLRENVKRISLEWHSPIVMPHLQHLDDGRHMERWASLVAKLADCGRLEIFGHPERGGLLWWSAF